MRPHAGVSDRQLGVALLCVCAGALASMQAAGMVIDRFRATAQPAARAVFAVTAVLPGPARSPAARERRRRHAEGLAERQTLGQVGLAFTKRLFVPGMPSTSTTTAGASPARWPRSRPSCATCSARRAQQQAHPLPAPLRQQPAQDLARAMDVRHRAGPRADQQRRRTLLRGPVIARELSHGTRTDDGEHFIARELSASVTCRLLGRSLFAHLATSPTCSAPTPRPAAPNAHVNTSTERLPIRTT